MARCNWPVDVGAGLPLRPRVRSMAADRLLSRQYRIRREAGLPGRTRGNCQRSLRTTRHGSPDPPTRMGDDSQCDAVLASVRHRVQGRRGVIRGRVHKSRRRGRTRSGSRRQHAGEPVSGPLSARARRRQVLTPAPLEPRPPAQCRRVCRTARSAFERFDPAGRERRKCLFWYLAGGVPAAAVPYTVTGGAMLAAMICLTEGDSR